MTAVETCALCPRLCRAACPVAVSSGREAAVPAVIAEVLLAWQRGLVDADLAREAATLCADCGACQAICHLGTPLPAALVDARAKLCRTPVVAPLPVLEGSGRHVAVQSDGRDWGMALAVRLGAPVAVLRTPDALGLALRGRPAWAARAAALRRLLEGRRVWVADGGVSRALSAAGVAFNWLHEGLGMQVGGRSCAQGASACCGGASPLREAHPVDAARMAAAWPTGGVADALCRAHLRSSGRECLDTVDQLLGVGDV